jgi:NAD+ synthase (glutamine-hydrolysing)
VCVLLYVKSDTRMSNEIKIALGQFNVLPGMLDHNANQIVQMAQDASVQGADVIIFPEMCVSGYLLGDLFENDEFVEKIVSANARIVQALSGLDIIIVIGTLVVDKYKINEDGRVRKYNAAVVAQSGVVLENKAGLTFAAKILHPNYRIFDDSRHFFSLRQLANELNLKAADLIQPFEVNIKGVKMSLGVMTCEDMWDGDYHLKPAVVLKENGAEVLLNLSCSPWSRGKNAKRDRVISDSIARTGLPFFYVNSVGCQNNGKNFVVFDGGSTAYNSDGNITLLSPPYLEGVFIHSSKTPEQILARPMTDEAEEMWQAVVCGTRGYLATLDPKYRRKVVIGVSGGIDSANSVALFAHILGPENVIGINMPYKDFNSVETKSDAEALCSNLGVEYRVIPIDSLVDTQATLLGVKEGQSEHKSIQARMRMEVLAAVASQVDGLFTCNANKTEAAFGYGTLNGDMRGNFAPWLDCLKRDVYMISTFINQSNIFGRKVIPETLLSRQPMDELVASGSRGDPFDYGSASHFGYHDQLVRYLVEYRKGKDWFVKKCLEGNLEAEIQLANGKLSELFVSEKNFVDDLDRCLKLFYDMIFKRVQSVPAVLLSKRSFGFDLRESIMPYTFFDSMR